MKVFLTKPVDNAPLVVFRILFGSLLAYQSFYYLCDGWVKRNIVGPKFLFSHIGFEWLRPLPGNGMYFVFAFMGILAIAVAAGFFYKFSLTVFTLIWTCIYWMQKTTYNNHHYLIVLICVLLLMMPAEGYASADARRVKNQRLSMPNWCRWLMIAQMFIVYFYAAIAKLYPGWLDGTFSGIVLGAYGRHYGIGILTEHWLHLFVAWGGFLFDLLIVPMMIWKRTRWFAFGALVLFHAFNSVTLDIGIFPFFALGISLFFFEPDGVRRLFFPRKPTLTNELTSTEAKTSTAVVRYFVFPYLLLQLLLPLRHWLINGDVLWTEEGHRLSWRMMLRDRKGTVQFTVIDRKTRDTIPYKIANELTKKQRKALATHPDMIWQMARHIRQKMMDDGRDVAVYARSEVSVNDGPKRLLIDPAVDLAVADWDYFGHCDWILLYE